MDEMSKVAIGESFRTHIEVLEKCFGISVKGHQQGVYKLNDAELVWFPKEDDDTWGNKLQNNGTEILENIPDENARVRVNTDHKYRRYTFLKRKGAGYCFVGVFEWDSEKSTHDYTIYKRVAEFLP